MLDGEADYHVLRPLRAHFSLSRRRHHRTLSADTPLMETSGTINRWLEWLA